MACVELSEELVPPIWYRRRKVSPILPLERQQGRCLIEAHYLKLWQEEPSGGKKIFVVQGIPPLSNFLLSVSYPDNRSLRFWPHVPRMFPGCPQNVLVFLENFSYASFVLYLLQEDKRRL